jgi:hypothetical protein
MKKVLSTFRFNAFAAGALLFMGVAFSACNKSNNDNPDVPVAGLMAVHLAPDVNRASITLSGNTISNPLSYNSFTGSYLAIYPGSRDVVSYDYNNGSQLATANFNFEADKYYSVFLVGADTGYRNVVVRDNFDSLSATAGKAYIRYINGIPDASSPTVTIASNGSNVVNENAQFASVSDFKEVNAGDVAITVSNGGSINANRTISLEQHKIYTVLLAGLPSGTGDQAVQIKYITNGLLDENTEKQSSVTARSAN